MRKWQRRFEVHLKTNKKGVNDSERKVRLWGTLCADKFRSSALKTLLFSLLYILKQHFVEERWMKRLCLIESMNAESRKGLAKYYSCARLIDFCNW